MRHRSLAFAGGVLVCLAVVTGLAAGAKRKPAKDFTKAQLEAKFTRIRESMKRVERLKERGYMPGTIREARDTVKIVEDEFGEDSFVIVQPLYTLIELLAQQKEYGEAEELFEKIYAIIDVDDDRSYAGYAIAHRLRIARLYTEWNMLEKAEATLQSARDIITSVKLNYAEDQRYIFTDDFYSQYSKLIDEELEKVNTLMDANKFNKRF